MILIIDEISMVSRTLFNYQINLRLIEKSGVNKPFGGLSVILYSDFYQLPPVNSPAIYFQLDLKKGTVKDINDLEPWYLFKMVELTEVMRQKGDSRLIHMLNKIRVGNKYDAMESLLKTRLAVKKKHIQLILCICLLKKLMINHLNSECVLIKAIDKFPTKLVF